MERQARLANSSYILVFAFLVFSCDREIVEIIADDPALSQNAEQVLYNHIPFTGIIFQLDKNGDTTAIDFFEDGLQQGRSMRKISGRLVEERFFEEGKRVGVHRGWHQNGQLRFRYEYEAGLMHGLSEEWYENGNPYKKLHYINGYESGMQTMWRPDGRVAMNYDAKNGRNYGLSGAMNCENLWDSVRITN